MAKKNKEMFKGEGGTFSDYTIYSALYKNHEIKIAILLGFFSLELYLRIISENKISKVDSELYYYCFKVIERLYLILHRKNITSKTRIKFSDLKSIGLGSFINNFIEKLNITADTLAQKFIEKCESLKFPTSDIDTGINSYHSYVYRFFISTQQQHQKNKITKKIVVNVIEALINNGKLEFDDYQLNYGNQFTIDITRMCGSKINLLTDIDILVKQLLYLLLQVKQLQGELAEAQMQVKQLQGELAEAQMQVKQLQSKQQKEEEEEEEEEEAGPNKYQQRMNKSSSNDSGVTAADVVGAGNGGKKSKKLPKKDILGKTKSIHKIPGDRKEYVKHKGKLITVKSYKELMKKKK